MSTTATVAAVFAGGRNTASRSKVQSRRVTIGVRSPRRAATSNASKVAAIIRARSGFAGFSGSGMEELGRTDRKSGGEGKSASVRGELGGRRIIKKKKKNGRIDAIENK